jgi:hypothetical protein
MDLIKSLIKEKGGDLVSHLTEKAGFNAEQAEAFVPEAFTSVMDAVKGGADAKDTDGLLGKIDLAGLASKVGIDSGMAKGGLTAILPMIMSLLGSKAGGLGAITSMFGGGGDVAGKLGGLAGGLFGKK